jgi:hypothetical protein
VTGSAMASHPSRPSRGGVSTLAAIVLTLLLLAAISPVYRDFFRGARDLYQGASFANFSGHLEYDRRVLHDFSWGSWFWNADKAMGMPRFGEILNRPIYPVHLVAVALLPTLTAWHWINVLHVVAATAGLVVLGRALGWPSWLAVLAAVGAMASHEALAHFSDVIDLAAAAWAPWQLWLTLKVLDRPRWGRWDAAWIACAALRFVGGNPNRVLYYEVLVLAVVLSFGWGRLRREIPRLAARYAVALMLAAPLLIPAFAHFAESARTHFMQFDDWHARRAYKWTSYALSLADLKRLLSPAPVWAAVVIAAAAVGWRVGPLTRALGGYLAFVLLHTIHYAPFWWLMAVLPGVRIPQKSFEPIDWLVMLALVETAWLALVRQSRPLARVALVALVVVGVAASAFLLPDDPSRGYILPRWTRPLPERLAAAVRAEPRAPVLLATAPERAADAAQPILNSNHNFFLGIPSARFFGDVPTYAFMRAAYRVPGLLYIQRSPTALGDWEEMVDLYAELGIRWVIWDGDAEAQHPRLRLAGEEHGFRLYEIRDARPLVYPVPALRNVERPVVPRGAAELPSAGPFCYGCPPAPADAASAAPARVSWRWAPGAVSAEVDSARGTFVVLGETTSRGWGATVDGRATPIHQANEMFQAVWVPPGRHTLAWRFREPGFFIGLAVMAVGAAVVIWWLVRRPEAA